MTRVKKNLRFLRQHRLFELEGMRTLLVLILLFHCLNELTLVGGLEIDSLSVKLIEVWIFGGSFNFLARKSENSVEDFGLGGKTFRIVLGHFLFVISSSAQII